MKKLVLVLAGGLLMFASCSGEVTVTENGEGENGTTEVAEAGSGVIDVTEVISKATSGEINPGDVITVEGWNLGLLGTMDSDSKTLYLGKEGSNNGAIEASLASSGDEAKVDGIGFDKQVTIKGEFVELTNFDTKMQIKDCKVIEVK